MKASTPTNSQGCTTSLVLARKGMHAHKFVLARGMHGLPGRYLNRALEVELHTLEG